MNGRSAFIIALIAAALVQSCSSPMYTVEMEPGGTKILKGFFDRQVLERDSVFTWCKVNYTQYRPDSATINELRPLIKDLRFFIALGTWCGDSKHEVPKMLKIFDAIDVSNADIQLFGVDRSKKSQEGTTEKYNVQRVPTLIVFKGDQELGRIVENPRLSQEKDLLRILQK